MAKEDFDRYLVGSLAYSYGTPDHVEEGETDANEIEWWRIVVNRIHEMIEEGKLRPPYKKFDHPLEKPNSGAMDLKKELRDHLVKDLREGSLKSEQILKDHWDTIMEGRLFKRMQRACEGKGISYSELTREEWRELAIEMVLDKHKG